MVMPQKIKNNISLFVWLFSYFVVFVLSKIFFSIKTSYEDKNFQKIRKPVIVVSNHKNQFDPWIIFVSLPFKVFLRLLPIRPFAKDNFKKNSFLGFLASSKIIVFIYYIYNVITIPDVSSFQEKINPLIRALKENNTILIFPEGKIILNEDVGDFKKGAVALQEETGAPILPCSVRYGKRRFLRKKVEVSFGKAFYVPKKLLKNKEDYAEGRAYLRKEILRLYKKKNK
jgi:1-acyl-sn-glycerol-3-phosphate acyltransferase